MPIRCPPASPMRDEASSAAVRWRISLGRDARRADAQRRTARIVQWNVICLDIDGEVRAQEDLRLAQESLARASQAASLAELSASIAHEVNQPLAAVVANSHACQRWLMAEPPNIERAQKTVERIIRDANSAADVVSRIRALFKQSVERGAIRRSPASSPKRATSWPRRRRGGAFAWTSRSKAIFRLSRSIASRSSRF